MLFLTCLSLLGALIRVERARGADAGVCTTPDCVLTAARVLSFMDPSADPCTDFYRFACGGWIADNPIPSDRARTSTFDKLADDNNAVVAQILQLSGPEPYLQKPRALYRQCVDMDSRGDGRDLAALTRMSTSMKAGSLESRLATLVRLGSSGLFVTAVGIDDEHPERNAVFVAQGGLGLPAAEYYTSDEAQFNATRAAYARYCASAMAMLGEVDEVEAATLASSVLKVETQLARLFVPKAKLRDPSSLYNMRTIAALQADCPFLNWKGFFDDLFPGLNLSSVVVEQPTYLAALSSDFASFSPDDITRYLQWRAVSPWLPFGNEAMLGAVTEFKRALRGVEVMTPVPEQCQWIVSDVFAFSIGRSFIERTFSGESKNAAVDMVTRIKAAFESHLGEVEWLDNSARMLAKAKAEAMRRKIGYPDWILDNAKLQHHYRDFSVGALSFLENMVEAGEAAARRSLEKLGQNVDADEWYMSPQTVNAYYSPSGNEIVFPAGILQPPFYSHAQAQSLNFGGIGAVVGHELTHGFDDQGSKYDSAGRLAPWWDKQTSRAFQKEAQCLVDQYAAFQIDGTHVNGNYTLGENIADNGGIKQSLAAYRSWVAENGKEPSLPGLRMSSDQLFFLGFGQVWCGSSTPQNTQRQLSSDPHSPGVFRVLGTLGNSRAFTKAFQCSPESPMVAAEPCEVW